LRHENKNQAVAERAQGLTLLNNKKNEAKEKTLTEQQEIKNGFGNFCSYAGTELRQDREPNRSERSDSCKTKILTRALWSKK
jgi:hypothetical protein